MQTLEDIVDDVLEGLVQDEVLFTALDVSNKVKLAMPNARHREVRDMVRSKFTSHIEPHGWARSPITVTLADGSQVEALLYHPLSASWDLDTAYDDQKRTQVSARITVPVPASVASDGTVSVNPPVSMTAPTVTPPAVMPAKDLWDQMFNSQPSLFPRK
jgi:hypothetical protein